jgi:hypothetical protein
MIGLGWVLMYNSLVEKNYTSNKNGNKDGNNKDDNNKDDNNKDDNNKDGNNIKKINNIILNKDIKTTG